MVNLSSIHPSENVKRAEINWDTLEKTGEDPIEWQRYDELRDKLIKKYGEDKVFHYMFLEDDLMSLMGKGRTATELYYSTAGEIEARDVASRLKFNKNQRINALPDIDRTDVVFSDYGLSMDYLMEDEAIFNPDKLSFDSILKDVLKTAKEEDSRYIYLGRFPAEIVEKIKNIMILKIYLLL